MMNEVKLVELIYCEKERRGKGVAGDPIRIIPQLFEKDGTLVMEHDTQKKYTMLDIYNLVYELAKGLDEESGKKLKEDYRAWENVQS